MTRTIPLSQFMPYGAPDLIAAEPRHMTQAVMASSGLAVAALLLAIAFMPKEVTTVIFRRPTDLFNVPPPALPHFKPPDSPPSAPPVARGKFGVPVPVIDPQEKFEYPDAPPAPSGPEPGVGTTEQPVAPPDSATEADEIPDRTVWHPYEELPVAVREVKPEYPDIPRQAGVDGLVEVFALVGRDGRVMKVELNPKHSIPMLDDAALSAAKRWVFKPALMNGHAVSAWVTLGFRFRLNEY